VGGQKRRGRLVVCRTNRQEGRREGRGEGGTLITSGELAARGKGWSC